MDFCLKVYHRLRAEAESVLELLGAEIRRVDGLVQRLAS